MAGVQNDAAKGLKDGAREVFHGIAKGLIKKCRHNFRINSRIHYFFIKKKYLKDEQEGEGTVSVVNSSQHHFISSRVYWPSWLLLWASVNPAPNGGLGGLNSLVFVSFPTTPARISEERQTGVIPPISHRGTPSQTGSFPKDCLHMLCLGFKRCVNCSELTAPAGEANKQFATLR